MNEFNSCQANYYIVPTGLYSGFCFAFYQYVVPNGTVPLGTEYW